MGLRRIRGRSLVTAALLVLLFVVLVRTAWLCDDAYITLRTLDNWIAGHGLRWNIDERVQTYTNTLWLFALAPVVLATGEVFYTTMVVSIVVGLAAVIVAIRSRGPLLGPETGVGLLALAASHTFVDYSTSGLENPLTHLLLATFAVLFLRRAPMHTLALVASLAMLARPDAIVLLLPALALRFPWRSPTRGVGHVLLGGAPVLGWTAFSLLYYGFPLPNTAYAKLSVGHLGDEHVAQGFAYIFSSFTHDPLSVLAPSIIGALWLRERDRERGMLLLGAALYFAYVVWIGGDFMVGRFLAAPLFLSVVVLMSSDWLHGWERVAWPTVVVLALVGGPPPLLTGHAYGAGLRDEDLYDERGVSNERQKFFPVASLLNAGTSHPDVPGHAWADTGRRASRGPSVQRIDAIGFAGYYAGPRVHIVDAWALADPLLARLPPVFGERGHYTRPVPAGYLETLINGHNQIVDRDLRRYYQDLRHATRAPVFSRGRAGAIWRLNTGAHALETATRAQGPTIVRSYEVRNTTEFPEVEFFAWIEGAATLIRLDAASVPGRRYEVTARIHTGGVDLVAPGEILQVLDRLPERGVVSIGVSLKDPATSKHAQYVHRHAFFRDAGDLVFLVLPVETWNADFPRGAWEAGSTESVLRSVVP